MEFDFGVGVVFRQSCGIRVGVVVRRQDPDVARQVIRIQFRSGPVRKKSGFLRRILQRMHPLYSRLRNCYPAIPVCVKKLMLMLLSMIKPNMNTQYDIVIHRRKYPNLTFVSSWHLNYAMKILVNFLMRKESEVLLCHLHNVLGGNLGLVADWLNIFDSKWNGSWP